MDGRRGGARPARRGACGGAQRRDRPAARAVRIRAAGGSACQPAPDRPDPALRVVHVQARGLRSARHGRIAARRGDDHARRVRRSEHPREHRSRRLVRGRLRRRPGPPGGARAVPPLDPGPARRGARQGPAAVRHRGAPGLLHEGRAAQAAQPPAGRAARALRRLRRGRQRLAGARQRRPVGQAARAGAARPHPGPVDAGGLRGDRRLPRPHGAERRRRRAGQLEGAALARRQAVRLLPAAPAAQADGDRARVRGPLPVAARSHAAGREEGLRGLAEVPEGAQAAQGDRRHGARHRRLVPLRDARRRRQLVPVHGAAARLLDPRAVRGARGPRAWSRRPRGDRPRHPRDRRRAQRADRVGHHERPRRRRRPLRRAAGGQGAVPLQGPHPQDELPERDVQGVGRQVRQAAHLPDRPRPGAGARRVEDRVRAPLRDLGPRDGHAEGARRAQHAPPRWRRPTRPRSS